MLKLLIVDDEPYIRKSLSESIDWGSLGFEVCATAADGLGAVELLHRHRPEVVLTDITMSRMDGLELLRYISEKGLPTRAVVLSGYDSFEFVRQSLRYRVEDYLLKPINEQELAELFLRLRRQIEAQRSGAEDDGMGRMRQLSEDAAQVVLQDYLTGRDSEPSKLQFLLGARYSFGWFSLYTLQFEPSEHQAADARIKEHLARDRDARTFILPEQNFLAVLQCGLEEPSPRITAEALLRAGAGDDGSARSESLRVLYLPPVFDLKALPKGYACLRDAAGGAFYLEFGHAYDASAVLPPGSAAAAPDLAHLEEPMVEAILNGGGAELARLTREYRRLLLALRPPQKSVLFCSYELYIRLCTLVKARFPLFEPPPMEQALSKLAASGSFSGFFTCFDALLQQLLSTVRDRSGRNPDIITSVCEFINENYDDKLSLELLSEHFFINRSYLCTLFCQKTGRNLFDYIRGVRMEKARAMLDSTGMNINEIASAVGYSDYRHFTKLFKTQYRQTPTCYRMLRQSRRRGGPARTD